MFLELETRKLEQNDHLAEKVYENRILWYFNVPV